MEAATLRPLASAGPGDGGDPSAVCDQRLALRFRGRAAANVLERHGALLRRAALRISICEADADDALARSIEIALTKAPPELAPRHLAAWLHVVVRREALAVRRQRERWVSAADPALPESGSLERTPSPAPDPLERLLRDEQVAERRSMLAALKPQERLAISLQAQGYSYAEIMERCDWSYTKVNRCLAEGRARLRELAAAAAA